ncbi:hypothetical protein D8Y22_01830 [Salinadaptatus halalkaliphilus]|uniref:DUF2795 domain-containing protein n=1 Tax=Salinadaptatus halalkaliphilus TaxID=2419781 RepID=A0A4S3TQA4_9EURY|nr:hypothetical protein [Salinadaptatus halalkaliphilus]THE66562.1 hypothetical protein D8Y22_01830 [Salinadaptatus halalkaliphilus]
MTDSNSVPRRELGVEFGELAGQIEDHSYPSTSDELVEEYGDYVLELPNGTESVRDILEPASSDTYESPGEARQALFNMVDSRAIGRRYYSDRTPPALGERREDQQLSF